MDWASCPDSDIAPWHGIHRGKAEAPNFFKALGETLQVTEFTPLSFTSNETDVMVVTRCAATAPATGKSMAMDPQGLRKPRLSQPLRPRRRLDWHRSTVPWPGGLAEVLFK